MARSDTYSDQELTSVIADELLFQDETINLIAAANCVSPAVRAAMDPRLQNIHSEGYPGRRYHEGQQVADRIEELAVARAKQLFGVDHANVQPYRGTMANLAAAMAVLQPGDSLMGFECRAGGHYSTGTDIHCIGKFFEVIPYTIDPDTNLLDYDLILSQVRRVKPKAIFCGDTAYPGLWDYSAMATVARSVGAVLIVDMSQVAGLVAGGAIPSPVPYADIITAATYKTLRGPRAGLIMCRAEFGKAINRAVYPLCQGGPNIMLLSGLAAALREALTPAFTAYAHQVVSNARALASRLAELGFDLVTGGTETHACLVNLRARGVAGSNAAARLAAARIICNGNQIPFDPGPPTQPSGLRLGTALVTTLGMAEREMSWIADVVAEAFQHFDDSTALKKLGAAVTELRQSFPLTEAV